MDFAYSDEQQMLADMLSAFVSDRYGFEERLSAMGEPEGFSRAVWRQLAELGILAIPFAEAEGGIGGGGVEIMIAMEAFGKALLVEPYLATIVLGGGVLRLAGSAAQRADRVPKIIAGDHLMALAHHEPGGPRHSIERLKTRALREGDAWRLEGEKTAVIAGAAADELIVSARDGDVVRLFLVEPADAGVEVERRTGYDGLALGDVRLSSVTLTSERLLGEGDCAPVLARLFEEATAAVCAEAVGIMSDMLEMTTDYLRTRNQFGVPIGSFQALQHRAVDMLMEVELARSMAILAALALPREGDERALNIAAAKARIGQAARFVGQSAVQLHGAIGLTEEYKVGHAFKRLTAIQALFGDADHHVEAVAHAGGLPPLA